MTIEYADKMTKRQANQERLKKLKEKRMAMQDMEDREYEQTNEDVQRWIDNGGIQDIQHIGDYEGEDELTERKLDTSGKVSVRMDSALTEIPRRSTDNNIRNGHKRKSLLEELRHMRSEMKFLRTREISKLSYTSSMVSPDLYIDSLSELLQQSRRESMVSSKNTDEIRKDTHLIKHTIPKNNQKGRRDSVLTIRDRYETGKGSTYPSKLNHEPTDIRLGYEHMKQELNKMKKEMHSMKHARDQSPDNQKSKRKIRKQENSIYGDSDKDMKSVRKELRSIRQEVMGLKKNPRDSPLDSEIDFDGLESKAYRKLEKENKTLKHRIHEMDEQAGVDKQSIPDLGNTDFLVSHRMLMEENKALRHLLMGETNDYMPVSKQVPGQQKTARAVQGQLQNLETFQHKQLATSMPGIREYYQPMMMQRSPQPVRRSYISKGYDDGHSKVDNWLGSREHITPRFWGVPQHKKPFSEHHEIRSISQHAYQKRFKIKKNWWDDYKR